jgi:hypothetical protein
MPQRNPR